MSESCRLIISLDVEEEGLFSGTYPRIAPGVTNVALLERLAFLPDALQLPLTYLIDYPVTQQDDALRAVAGMMERHGGEIGAHLHQWNTPPFVDMPWPEPVGSDKLPEEVFAAKLETLTSAIEERLGVRPQSFRMGRWDMRPRLLPALAEEGYLVDSSFVPLRHVTNGPNHFLTPPDPFWMRPMGPDGPRMLEAPSTQIPLIPGLERLAYGLAGVLPGHVGETVLTGFKTWGALGINPVWMPLATMKYAAATHIKRGGRTLTMFWHSSELLPGASPHFPTQSHVDAFIDKIRTFAEWLTTKHTVRGATFSDLVELDWLERELPGERGTQ
ncbi:hypothetical protein [Desulfovibrio inopinatus]|uniref:hypothetical protein n=1 Tax=Desulfovibrio inopinatus TaxID=102109 RepID=UPI00054EA99E|nr:hypothetical protein [Desulfovibrio inopinatus]